MTPVIIIEYGKTNDFLGRPAVATKHRHAGRSRPVLHPSIPAHGHNWAAITHNGLSPVTHRFLGLGLGLGLGVCTSHAHS